jgi:hypothetical protein
MRHLHAIKSPCFSVSLTLFLGIDQGWAVGDLLLSRSVLLQVPLFMYSMHTCIMHVQKKQ